MAKPKPITLTAARGFCFALWQETKDMPTGSWRMLRTIAEKLRISDHDAERIANDCQARGWVEFKHGSVRLEEEGRRQVA